MALQFFVYISFFLNMHQVLVGLPQGVDDLAFLYIYNTHQVLVGLLQGVDRLAVYIYFFLVYFYNTHQMLVGLPQGVGGLAILFYFYLSLFVYYAPSARRVRPKG